MRGQEIEKIDSIELHRARETTKIYNYYYIIFILYTVNIYYVFLHVNLFLYISVISKKSSIQYLTYIIVTSYISLQRKSLEYF